MFRVQFYDIEENRIQTAKFKIEENSGGGDCLFKTLHSFLQYNKKKINYSAKDDFELRKFIVEDVVNKFDYNYVEEIKFNLENDVPFFSSLNLEDISKDEDLKRNCLVEYEKHMSMNGSCGTIFELNAAAKLFGFVGAVFIKKGNKFDCLKFGFSDNPEDDLKPKLFILFNGPTSHGHFRLLKPITIASLKAAKNIPGGEYSILNELNSSVLIAKCNQNDNGGVRVTNQQNDSQNNLNSLICPLCPDSSKTFKTKVGLKIHFTRKHPDKSFNSIFVPEVQEDDSMTFKDKLCKLRVNVKILKRIPKSARIAVANKLSELIEECVKTNDLTEWKKLMTFSYYALRVTKKSSKSLSSIVKKNLINPENPLTDVNIQKPTSNLKSIIESKIADGDVQGAVRLLSSEETIAPQNKETFEKLLEKHPSPSRTLNYPEPPNENSEYLVVSEKEVRKSINSFKNGSAGGIDGLRPQHLKDLITKITGEAGVRLLRCTTQLCNIILAGKVCNEIAEYFYGATLCALTKKDGGIRPIAVGNTFRRLAAKLGCNSVIDYISNLFKPTQLGFGAKGGCEAILHAVRTYLKNNKNLNKILLKIDFINAFNSIERDEMLKEIKKHAPKLYPFLWQCYYSPSLLFFGNDTIPSQIGCQQGDPCGPLVFCLAIHSIISSLKQEINVWYLDDGTLADKPELVLENFKTVIEKSAYIGLKINPSKCELHFCDEISENVVDCFNQISPGIRVMHDDIELLGSSLYENGCRKVLLHKLDTMNNSFEKLKIMKAQVAYYLLKHCFWIPKLSYILRTTPTWLFPDIINKFDLSFKKAFESITNIQFNDFKWTLCSLPIKDGGTGIRMMKDIGLPAFLSSVNSTRQLVNYVLSNTDSDEICVTFYNEALNEWKKSHTIIPVLPSSQKNWDTIIINSIKSSFNCSNKEDSARFLASQTPESSAWLNVLPSKTIGTLMQDNVFRIALSLRYGCDICIPHKCSCNKATVNSNGIHGLSCSRSAARSARHSAFNMILKLSLSSAQIPSRLEPIGLNRNNNERTDGITLIPWSNGRFLTWDATCRDTLAPSYIDFSSITAGKVAERAAKDKRRLYKELLEHSDNIFIPFAIETLGPIYEEGKKFICDIGKKIEAISDEPRSTQFLFQRISIALQNYNAGCVMGTLPESESLNEIFLL